LLPDPITDFFGYTLSLFYRLPGNHASFFRVGSDPFDGCTHLFCRHGDGLNIGGRLFGGVRNAAQVGVHRFGGSGNRIGLVRGLLGPGKEWQLPAKHV
jgi:hypothetical protein